MSSGFKVQSSKFKKNGAGHRERAEESGKEVFRVKLSLSKCDICTRFMILILLFQLTTPLIAQNDSVPNHTKINGKYLLSYWTDTKTIAASPFHWKGKQWLTFTGVVGATALLYAYDDKIYNSFQSNRTETKDNVSKYLIEPWGSGMYSLPLLAGIYLTGSKNSRHRNIALTGVKAYLLGAGAAYILKNLFHRHRPYENAPPDPRRWDGPLPFTNKYKSFPSGHTTTAFAIASVLAHGYKDKLWIVLSSYSVATLVGVSRLYDGRHWASDVLAGAALGTFIGATLSRVNFKNINIGPAAFHGGYGVQMVYHLK